MTDCVFREQLSAYHDGDLAAAEAEQVRQHVAAAASCGCREELAALHTLVRDLRDLAPGPVPPGGWERMSARLDGRRSRRWEWMLPLAALLLLAFSILLFRSAGPTTPGTDAGGTAAIQPPPRPAESEIPGTSFTGEAGDRPVVAAGVGAGSGPRASRPPRPRFQTVALKASLPPTRVPVDLVVAYGAEVEPIDRLLRALRRVAQEGSGSPRGPQAEPQGERGLEPGRETDVQAEIEALEALRADVMAELVMEAQARAAAPWR